MPFKIEIIKRNKIIHAQGSAKNIIYLTLIMMIMCAEATADNSYLSKIGALIKNTGYKDTAETIEQKGRKADDIKSILKTITLPPGFKINLFAVVPDARHMAVKNNSSMVWIGTRKSKVWLAVDHDKNQIAESVEEFSPKVKFDIPNGVCLSPDGELFVAERNRVLMFPTTTSHQPGTDIIPVPIVPQGTLIPLGEESSNHSARVCVFGPDNNLYISLGQPYNVTPSHKREMYLKNGIGGIIRMKKDGSNREIVATGIRNSVGHAFNPADGILWFTDNQVDGMGDDTPPGEINKLSEEGSWFGYPYFGGGNVRTHLYRNETIPQSLLTKYRAPQVETIAHAADLGMMFYSGEMFPDQYKHAIFSAQHGSWNSSVPRGPQIMVTFLDEDGNAEKTEVFAYGWLQGNGSYSGRPVDIQQFTDGSILVSDDKAGAVYRISYQQ